MTTSELERWRKISEVQKEQSRKDWAEMSEDKKNKIKEAANRMARKVDSSISL
jgi:hypothetical protein